MLSAEKLLSINSNTFLRYPKRLSGSCIGNKKENGAGNKDFTTATLVVTLLATDFGGGGLLRTVEEVHATGLYYIIITVFSANFSQHCMKRAKMKLQLHVCSTTTTTRRIPS